MDRAFARLPKDPTTGKPFRHFGLTAPLSAFRRLGDGIAAYIVLLHTGLAFAAVGSLLAIAPIALNRGNATGYDGDAAQGSLGGAGNLYWLLLLTHTTTSSTTPTYYVYEYLLY